MRCPIGKKPQPRNRHPAASESGRQRLRRGACPAKAQQWLLLPGLALEAIPGLGWFHYGCWWLGRLLSWALLAQVSNGTDEQPFAPSSLAGRKVSIIVPIVGIVAMRTAIGDEREHSDGVRDGWGSGCRPLRYASFAWAALTSPRVLITCRPRSEGL